ncbi:MAG: ATP-grasp domain-containing protein [Clostridia bacterium]|nr:ATP-grasp domain-containing protein [Clostridia bacterium]
MKVFLQMNSASKLEIEELAIKRYFENDNTFREQNGQEKIEIIPFYKKHMLQGKVNFTKDDFVSGEIQTMHYVFKKLGVDYSYEDYPEILKKYLHRNIWEDIKGNITNEIIENDHLKKPVFVKPKDKLKAFTGFVCDGIDDLWKFNNVSDKTKIICSDPVCFVNEYRFYIIDGEIKAYALCPGNYSDLDLDISVVNNAAKEYGKTCVMDFGKLTTGETALIEVNEAYSVGLYNDSCYSQYVKMLLKRWNEIVGEN